MFLTLSIEDKYAYLVKCSNAYYETGKNLIDDKTFDEYVEYYEKQSNKKFKYLGRSNNKKCELPVYMGSLEKIKTEDRLVNFVTKYVKNSIIFSEKLDGCSMLIFTDDKGILHLSNRGDGRYGSDLTHLLSYINLPKNIPKEFVIRGEFCMKKKIYEEYYSKSSDNCRNFVSGLINSKTLDEEALKRCDFVAHGIPNSKYDPKQVFEALKKIGFITPIHAEIAKTNLNINVLSELLLKIRSSSDYEMDGLVISDNNYHLEKDGDNPKYTIAFKKDAESKEATIIDILWEESRYGLLKPRVQIKPLDFGGVVIQFLTAYNASYVKNNNLGPGSIIKVCRSGDVIPDIVGIVQSTKAKMPPEDSYEWTESVDIRVKVKSTNSAKQIAHFFTVCGAKGIKEATIEKCIAVGLNTIEKIIDAKANELLKAEGIKEKSADKIIEQCILAKQNCSTLNIMEGSCVFEGFGEKKLQKIIETLPEIKSVLLNNKKYDAKEWENLLNNVGIKTQASTFIEQFKLFHSTWSTFYNKYCIDKNSSNETKQNKNKINQKCNFVVVFTGIRDVNCKERIENMGGKVTESISKQTTHLVVKDKHSTSSKMEKAKELGIQIVTVEEMNELLSSL